MNHTPETPRYIKVCGCGKKYTKEQWVTLGFVGDQHVPEDGFGPEESLELRNCLCGSTIAIERRPRR